MSKELIDIVKYIFFTPYFGIKIMCIKNEDAVGALCFIAGF